MTLRRRRRAMKAVAMMLKKRLKCFEDLALPDIRHMIWSSYSTQEARLCIRSLDHSVYIQACYYILLLDHMTTLKNVRDVFVTCIMIASKCLVDDHYQNNVLCSGVGYIIGTRKQIRSGYFVQISLSNAYFTRAI